MTREEALAILRKENGVVYSEYEEAVDVIEKALADRPHGEWEYTGCVNDELQPEFCCSICNFSTYSRQFNFCPNCGADMRKEGDRNDNL